MFWKQSFFRIIGATSFAGGIFAFYDFGRELLPLFERFVSGSLDSFEAFTVLTSFFLGAVALVWVGLRALVLRSFSRLWLYYATLPLTVWLQELYDVGLIGAMDRILSLSITYLFVYVLIVQVTLFVHKHWYTPLSHESMRHVALEKPETSVLFELRWVILCIGLVVLLILHPADIGTTIDMVVSSIVYGFNLLR